MSATGIILTAGLTIGLLAQSCDVGGLTIDDLSDTVTVTNASSSQTAMVLISTSQGRGQVVLAPGTSRTFTTIAAAKYTVEVGALGGAATADYEASLVELRNDFMDLSINPADSGATVETALAALVSVETALHQLESNGLQACSHAIANGAGNHATMTWTAPGGMGGLWDLTCA
jgi:hypothetical protein